MRKSTIDKPIRLQQIVAYTYKGKDVLRSWINIPSYIVRQLELKKGDLMMCTLTQDAVVLKKVRK